MDKFEKEIAEIKRIESDNLDTILQDALDKVTVEMVRSMTYGEEIELNEKYSIYHYSEIEVVSIVETEEWEEVFAVQIGRNEIIFEKI
jgi:hypothetical protein